MKRKAFFKNKDEFYQKMITMKSEKNKNQFTDKQLKLFRTQDENYLQLQRTQDKNKIEKMEESLNFFPIEATKQTHAVCRSRRRRQIHFGIVGYYSGGNKQDVQ